MKYGDIDIGDIGNIDVDEWSFFLVVSLRFGDRFDHGKVSKIVILAPINVYFHYFKVANISLSSTRTKDKAWN